MRKIHWATASIAALGLATTLWGAVPSGVRGVVDRKLEGVVDYNQAIEDAMNDGHKQPPAAAPAPAGAVKSGWMTRKTHDGKEIKLFFAYPEALTKDKPTAALVLLPEWWGLNDEMQDRARTFATKGFYAIVPDFFAGKTTDDPGVALNMRQSVTDAMAMNDMKAGLDLLQEEEGNGVVDAKRVGVIGWDMGAHQALLLSQGDSRIRATALFYGPLVTDYTKLNALQGPVLGIFGTADKNPSAADVKKFQDALKTAGRTDVTVYQIEGAGHDFATRSGKNGGYDEEKARDAMDKLNAWLDAKLPR